MTIKHHFMVTLGILVALYATFMAPNDIETDSEFIRILAYFTLYGFSIGVGILIPFSEVNGIHLHRYIYIKLKKFFKKK